MPSATLGFLPARQARLRTNAQTQGAFLYAFIFAHVRSPFAGPARACGGFGLLGPFNGIPLARCTCSRSAYPCHTPSNVRAACSTRTGIA